MRGCQWILIYSLTFSITAVPSLYGIQASVRFSYDYISFYSPMSLNGCLKDYCNHIRLSSNYMISRYLPIWISHNAYYKSNILSISTASLRVPPFHQESTTKFDKPHLWNDRSHHLRLGAYWSSYDLLLKYKECQRKLCLTVVTFNRSQSTCANMRQSIKKGSIMKSCVPRSRVANSQFLISFLLCWYHQGRLVRLVMRKTSRVGHLITSAGGTAGRRLASSTQIAPIYSPLISP